MLWSRGGSGEHHTASTTDMCFWNRRLTDGLNVENEGKRATDFSSEWMVVSFTKRGRGGGGGLLGDGNPKNLFVKFKFKLLLEIQEMSS